MGKVLKQLSRYANSLSEANWLIAKSKFFERMGFKIRESSMLLI